jgi:hypothetical protein
VKAPKESFYLFEKKDKLILFFILSRYIDHTQKAQTKVKMKIFFWGLLYLTSSLYADAGQNCVKPAKKAKTQSASSSPCSDRAAESFSERQSLEKQVNMLQSQGTNTTGSSILNTLGLNSGKEKRKDHTLFREAYLFWKSIFSTHALNKKFSLFKSQNFATLTLSRDEKKISAYLYQQNKNNNLLTCLKMKDIDRNPEKMIEAAWNITDLLYNKKEKDYLEEATFCNFAFDIAKTVENTPVLQKLLTVSRNSEKFFSQLKILERSFPPMDKEFLFPFLRVDGIKDIRSMANLQDASIDQAGMQVLAFFKKECYQELFDMLPNVLDNLLNKCLVDTHLSSDIDISDAVALYAYHGIQKCCQIGEKDSAKAQELYQKIYEKTKEAFSKLKNPNQDLPLLLGDLFSFGNPLRSQWMKDHGNYQFYDYPAKNFLLNTVENFYDSFYFYQHAAENFESSPALFEVITRKFIYFPIASEKEELESFEEALETLAKDRNYAEATRILFEIYFEMPKHKMDPAFSIPVYQKLLFELKNKHGVSDLCLNSLFQQEISPKKNFEVSLTYLRLGCMQKDFVSQFIWAYLSRYGLIVQLESDPSWIDVFMRLGYQEHTLALDWIKENEKAPELLVSNTELSDYTHEVMRKHLETLKEAPEKREFRFYFPLKQYQKKLAGIYLETLDVFDNEIKKETQSVKEDIKANKTLTNSSIERRETSFF